MDCLGIHVQPTSKLNDPISGRARIDELGDFDTSEILAPDTAPSPPSQFRTCISGKAMMVTGACGSIGSQLCRQITPLISE